MHPEQDNFIEQLHRAHFGKLTIYAAASLKDQGRAQDVVQDTFHEAVRHIGTLMAHPNPGGWLMQTLKYKIQEDERAHHRQMRRFLSLNTDLLAESGRTDPRLDRDERPLLDQIQAALTPEEYHLLVRLTIDRASHLEVAQELGISVWACQKRLERVRKKLYDQFPERKPKKNSKKS